MFEFILKNKSVNYLKIADDLGLESIAFPSISTGIYSYPLEEAAKIAAKTIYSFKSKSIKNVYMCIFPEKLHSLKAYNDAFGKQKLLLQNQSL